MLLFSALLGGNILVDEKCKMLDMVIHTKLFQNSFYLCDSDFNFDELIIIDTSYHFKDCISFSICDVPIRISNEKLNDKNPHSSNIVFSYWSRVFRDYYTLSFYCPASGNSCGFLIRKKIKNKKYKYKIIDINYGSLNL